MQNTLAAALPVATHSDLWWPLAAVALLALLPVLVYFVWTQARWAHLKKRSLLSPAARQTARNFAAHSAASADDGLVPLDALTAQPRPVVLLEEYWPAEPQNTAPETTQNMAIDAAHHAPLGRVEPSFAGAAGLAASPISADALPEQAEPEASADLVFTAPARVAVLTVAPPELQAPSPAELLPPHAVMQYVIRLVWQRPPIKEKVHAALADLPWPGAMPVQHWLNASGTAMELGLYLVNRKQATQARDFAAFDRWARVLANSLGADEPPTFLAETALLQTRAAQHLLGDLDSVFNVRLHVPASQFNLFEQSLVAARFTAVDEHWLFQEHKHHEGLWLERLWGAQAAKETQSAIFQMAIDIPHLGVLEARKAYMRLRAVARASAVIVQTDQGAHLSEGMLEKFAREITARQELLAKAGIEPGSASAKVLFKPRIKMQKDFAAFGAPQG